MANEWSSAPRPRKDRSLALILEIFPGLFGFFGIGWIYSGNALTGVLLLIGMFFWEFLAFFFIFVTFGLGALCIVPFNLIVLALSAFFLNGYTGRRRDLFG